MKKLQSHRLFVVSVSISLALFLSSLMVRAQGTKSSTSATSEPPSDEVSVAQQALRAYLLAQEQLRAIQRDIEQSHKDAEAAAQRNAEAIAGSLNLIAQNLATQRERELEAMHDSNRTMLIVAGSFGGIGFLAMVFTAWFQMRSMNRLTEVASALRLGQSHDYPFAALGTGDSQRVALDPVEQSNRQYLGAIERLQKRIYELEHSTAPLATASENGHPDGESKETPQRSDAPSSTDAKSAGVSEQAAQVSLMLGKSQTLLNLGQHEEALACVEEALAIDPANIEALLKKGTVLERLQRMEEAIEIYDRAIAVDNSKTTAYLLKGGVFNRLKRYPEALACYDEALRAQQKSSLTN
ncbi:MAG: tetratricopeptide repeat protein [Verrucomicrobia bacterium]|nr:tetratricopeptide repeat protein [Verrucomicrobiota bacterium]